LNTFFGYLNRFCKKEMNLKNQFGTKTQIPKHSLIFLVLKQMFEVAFPLTPFLFQTIFVVKTFVLNSILKRMSILNNNNS
jgi:hypothetical protein